MIPKECKRLAEVDFPIAVVSKHSAREKSMRLFDEVVQKSLLFVVISAQPSSAEYRFFFSTPIRMQKLTQSVGFCKQNGN